MGISEQYVCQKMHKEALEAFVHTSYGTLDRKYCICMEGKLGCPSPLYTSTFSFYDLEKLCHF